MASSRAFDDLVARAHRDPAVAGLILSGSQAWVGMATERSDYDVYTITDGSIADGEAAWVGTRSGDLDVAVIPLDEFGGYALPGHPQEWNRYSFAWARVRPYNKYLGWELRQHPLADPAWDAGRLLPRLRRVLADGDPGTQRDLFGDLAVAARGAGLGHVLDAWGPDLVLLSA